jgi:hypothetical protein
MLIAAVLCPHPPLLLRELCGAEDPAPGLRLACAEAVSWLVEQAPEVVSLVGAIPDGAAAAALPARLRIDAGRFRGRASGKANGPMAGDGRDPVLPLSLGVAHRLLDEAGWTGPRIVSEIPAEATPEDCATVGHLIAADERRVGLLVAADGSACRSVQAPGYLDERAEPFDAAVLAALRSMDTATLLRISPGQARAVLAAGRPGWQVLAGAVDATRAAGRTVDPDIGYSDDPFGVLYVVARWAIGPAHG